MPDSNTQTHFGVAPAVSGAEPAGRAPKSALFLVFLVVFIDLLGFGIVLPLLPRYGELYVAAVLPGEMVQPGGVRESRAGGAILGLLMASFSAMQFLVAPLWGRISDRIGRRPVLLIGLAGSVVFYILFGYASDMPAEPASSAALALALLFAARIGAGVAGATISTAQAVIADCTPPERRKHGMALIGAAFGIGFTFGPLVGYAVLNDWVKGHFPWVEHHHGIVGYTAACLSLVALLLGLVLLPETRRFGTAPPLQRGWLDLHAIGMVLRSPTVGPVVLVFFLATLGFGGFEPTLALLIKDALGLNEDQSFLIFAYVGLVLVLTQGFLYRRLAKRVTEVAFMTAGILLMALGLLLLGGVSWAASQATSHSALLAWMLVSLALAVVGFALLTPSAQALISRRSDQARQGEVLGVNQSASALARILGPIFGLTLYKLTADHLLPYVFGAALLLVMLPLLPRIRRGGVE
jgi:DHA1 family tetracycline resistance protein-like MFS transporter